MPNRKLAATLAVAALLALASPATAQAPAPTPTVTPAIDGVLAAFKTHPVVALADYHGLAQQQDFYAQLIRDPRFAREVGNVVVEFGSASHQAIIDRYIAGEPVPYLEPARSGATLSAGRPLSPISASPISSPRSAPPT